MIKRLLFTTLAVFTFLFLIISKNAFAAGSCTCDSSGIVKSGETCSVNGTYPQCGKSTGGYSWCSCAASPSNVPSTSNASNASNNYLCSDGVNVGVSTALGCIPVQMDKFIAWLLPKLFGISGGIAFLLMVYGFILITTSNGDPKAVQGAKETITSAIIGLLISIFAIFILRLIAFDILKIPGIS